MKLTRAFTDSKSLCLSLAALVASVLVTSQALCQNVQQVPAALPVAAQGQSIPNQPTRQELRDSLRFKYDPTATQSRNQLYLLNPNDSTLMNWQMKLKESAAGTWTGGGGTGIACFYSGYRVQADGQDLLNPKAYDQIGQIILLDTARTNPATFISVQRDESSIHYLRRVFNEIYGPVLPEFSKKVLTSVEMIYAQLQEQLSEYQKNPVANPQLVLRDFSSPMAGVEQSLGRQCHAVQLVTRYAQIGLYQINDVIMDFDVRLLLKMKELAKTPEERTIQEAGLILHEALYLFATTVEQTDSSVITFGMIPFLLNQQTQQQLQGLSRIDGVRFLRTQFKQFGMQNYFLIHLFNETPSQNPVVQKHLLALPQLTKSLRDADEELHKNHGISSSLNIRDTVLYGQVLTDQLAKTTDKVGAFVALSSLIEFKYQYVFDDLFIDSLDQKAVIADACLNLRDSQSLFVTTPPDRNMVRVYERAMDYCKDNK